MASVLHTFFVALRSIATAATLASSGFYLHQRRLITSDGRQALAIISQQVAIPAFFFSKIIFCPQDYTKEECPNVLEHLSDVWILLLWPLYVVGCGLLVGEIAATLSSTPPCHRKMVRVSCGFANSTGLPLTLMAVLHGNFPTAGVSRVDPSLFLSIYVLVYQILQWGVAGWLLAEPTVPLAEHATTRRGVHHILNYIHHDSVPGFAGAVVSINADPSLHFRVSERRLSASDIIRRTDEVEAEEDETVRLLELDNDDHLKSEHSNASSDVAPLAVTVYNVLTVALQPPVVGALLGIFVASIRPLRSLFVDLIDRDNDAPLEWLYNGIYVIGQAAVPLNMCILGVNLSSSFQSRKGKEVVSVSTILAVVVGKLIIMPFIGILTTLLMKKYLWTMPDSISSSFYLVLMIVTITPTANNVIVMVELAGASIKEAMARIIFWQYAVTPVILSITVMLIVRVAYH